MAGGKLAGNTHGPLQHARSDLPSPMDTAALHSPAFSNGAQCAGWVDVGAGPSPPTYLFCPTTGSFTNLHMECPRLQGRSPGRSQMKGHRTQRTDLPLKPCYFPYQRPPPPAIPRVGGIFWKPDAVTLANIPYPPIRLFHHQGTLMSSPGEAPTLCTPVSHSWINSCLSPPP